LVASLIATGSFMIRHLFVYGTLRPSDVRWHLLEPFVADEGELDAVNGQLFDTGMDYPAAVFDAVGTIRGHSFALLETSLGRALAALDEVEDVVGGEYSRVQVRTGLGLDAWAYAYGSGLELTPIASGDWFVHRPPS
jgi:gamma-glutamylcyclotransferase (GGCT)/AIG2-like uncharacterized protein YtfP